MMQIEWGDVASDTGRAKTRDFVLQHQGRAVPGALWLPAEAPPEALILVGHGGSRHKRDESTLDFIAAVVESNNMAAAAIDGPIHGARGRDLSSRQGPDPSPDPSARQTAFLDLWKTPGNGIENMVSDWQASLMALLALPELHDVPIGYFGLSMGTAYGLPFAAADARIDAAVLGMWGANYPNSAVLVERASAVKCPVLFLHKSEDGFFTLEGGLEIYRALPNDDKCFVMHEGPHTPATPEQTKLAIRFLAERLMTGERP
ncbi:MAG: hypothetical protein CBD27_04690 [Rhodospirillaceae bacterium TMED167]|nr:hypothetical protein [Rhodospirillaceae bacterium]MDG2032971.1 dienelactone hydrolase family protein [Rhodospirillales bacterium]OUW28358.1 MAG: hypothetical protein CBD27_04690 [Rhodospirillaceae bacterium TMED167]